MAKLDKEFRGDIRGPAVALPLLLEKKKTLRSQMVQFLVVPRYQLALRFKLPTSTVNRYVTLV